MPVATTRRWWQAVRPRLDLAVLALLFVYLLLSNNPWLRLPGLPKGAPGGMVGVGAVGGAGLALEAIGMVLVLRANRIINFAQVQLGAVSAGLFYEIVHHAQLAVFVQQACGCLHGVSTDGVFNQTNPSAFTAMLLKQGYTGLLAANFWIAVFLCVLIAPLVSWLAYMLLMRRFASAPRLVATVVTIGLAQVLAAVAGALTQFFQDVRQDFSPLYLPLPHVRWYWSPYVFGVPDLLALGVVVAALVALAALFLLTDTGIAMRGVAENAGRALTLGISVSRLSSLSWTIAGLLSGIAGVIAVIQVGGTIGGAPVGGGASLSTATLVPILAAVVFARLTSFSLVVAASVVLGVTGQVLFWNYSSTVPYQGVLLLPLIAGALLLQQKGTSRADRESSAAYLGSREARPIPRELRRVPVVDAWLRWGLVLLCVAVVGFPLALNPSQIGTASVALIYALVGLSILVLTGWAGQVSLGQFAFAAVGGYVAALLGVHANQLLPLNLLIAGLAGALVAALVGIPALRLRGMYLAVSTLALALAVPSVLLDGDWLGRFLPSSINRPTIFGVNLEDERWFYYLALVVVVLAAAAVLGLRRSRIARALIASRDNEQASQSFGINLFWARTQAFALSGFLAAVAGGLFVYEQHAIEVGSFNPDQSVALFLVTLIGGLGSVTGPLLGFVYNGAILLWAGPLAAALLQGAGVIAILMLFPGGLSALVFRLRDAWLRRVAIRYRIIVPSLLADMRADALDQKAMIAPLLGSGGKQVFVPVRYRLRGQWLNFKERRA